MKKAAQILGLGVMFLVVSTGQLSAQKCKYDYEKKDPLTGEASKGSTFGVKLWWKLGLNKIGNQYYIGMWAQINANIRDVITPESTIIFKLANGEIITVYADNTYPPAAQATQYGIISIYNAKFNISAEDLQKMAASPLVYVRMEIGARNYDCEFKTKKGAEFQHKAGCIVQ
jgi:hypothetical protein